MEVTPPAIGTSIFHHNHKGNKALIYFSCFFFALAVQTNEFGAIIFHFSMVV